MYSNARNAVIQVKGEKKVLLHYLLLATTGLALMRCETDAQFEAMLGRVDEKKNPFVHAYCSIEISKLKRYSGVR